MTTKVKKELLQYTFILIVMISILPGIGLIQLIFDSMEVRPQRAGVILFFIPTMFLAFLLSEWYKVIIKNDENKISKPEDKPSKSTIASKKKAIAEMSRKRNNLSKNADDSTNISNRIIPISSPAYRDKKNVVVITKKFRGLPSKWQHKEEFQDFTQAEKFAQMVTEKGLINTQHWIDYNQTIYSKNHRNKNNGQ